jgi:hypothetical protein
VSGWVPMPADGWAETAELLTSSGRPWPAQAVITDLRWHVDQGRAIPGRPTLRARWHWSDWAVRTMLADEATWRDPLRGSPPADLQHTPARLQRPPASQRTEAVNQADSASVPPTAASGPPASLHTRGDPPSPPPPPSPEDGRLSADRYDEVAGYFGGAVHRAIGRRESKGPERGSKLGQKLLRAVRADADLVLDAMRLVAEGAGSKADFLRGYDGLSVATVLAHVDEYAELWRAQRSPAVQATGPPLELVTGDDWTPPPRNPAWRTRP